MTKLMIYLQKKNAFNEIFFVTTMKHLNDPKKLQKNDYLPDNVAICTEEKQSIHFQECVLKAKEIFHRLYPEEEVFPVPVTPTLHGGDTEEAEEVEFMVDELNRLQTSTSTSTSTSAHMSMSTSVGTEVKITDESLADSVV